ncbi:putative polyketide synthase [Amylocystis lapponica]|nr:putative polyketide synthase [Amylocystis lapponica]
MNAAPLDVFILDGQGTPSAFSPRTTAIALQDINLPLPFSVLLACHSAFLHEVRSLPVERQRSLEIDIQKFQEPHSLLDVDPSLRGNAVVANVNLYLTQLIRYLANVNPSFLDCSDGKTTGDIPFEVVGVSTGLLAATIIATIRDIPSLFVHAVEILRLAFWLGIRTQEFAHSISASCAGDILPWVLVLLGSDREQVQVALDRYNTANGLGLHLTAVLGDNCISLSGHPDEINKFKADYLPSSTISTSYHTTESEQVKAYVLADVERNNIHFPKYEDLRHRLRYTVDGAALDSVRGGSSMTLVEAILDMILIHPVNFELVLREIRSETAYECRPLRLVNLGPSTRLWKSLAWSLSDFRTTAMDWSTSAVGNHALPDAASSREPIAVIGMAVNLPGAENVPRLWELLENGLNTISEIPHHRFDVSQYGVVPEDSKRRMKSAFGNFLDNVDAFDNVFFRVSPREACSMDPQQRILLQVAYHALEDSGYVPNATACFDPDTFATYVGAATNDYIQNLRSDVDVYYSTGTLQAFLSGKISYAFGFSGPSMVVDTACSSSIIAIHQACRALANGDCNAAIAGGVNVVSSPDMYIGLDRAHFLSPTGQCRPWDASADGYCRSEGCGMFVLKRLSDALAEKDRIWGVIRGVEINQSAKAESITQPHVPTQVQLFKKLISATGLHPTQIGVVEAHGTGTQAGDPTELESIRSVFAVDRAPDNPLHITSVKANIGHAEAASGAASLAKLLLMMRKRTIPANISLHRLNPKIRDLSTDNIRIDSTAVSWDVRHAGDKRLALLNNFGAAGSNAALILGEPPDLPIAKLSSSPAVFVLGLSCKSKDAAERLRGAYLHHLNESVCDQSNLADFVYTATARRQSYRYRIAASGTSRERLHVSLKEACLTDADQSRGKIVFLFSGQGGQYLGMGSGLYTHVAFFRQIVDQCHGKLVSWGYAGVLGIINPTAGSIGNVETFQTSVFVLQYALASLWISWDVKPDAVAGHSLGEYTAMVLANVMTLDEGLRLVAERARLMSQKCESGTTGMLAVRESPSEVCRILASDNYKGLSIACYNSDTDCVVAGTIIQLDGLESELAKCGVKSIRLSVQYGYHTCAMHPILDRLRQLGSQLQLSAPTIPILSNVYGRFISADDTTVFSGGYFARHCVEPVRFAQGIRDLMSREDFSAITACIDFGPHPTTLPMLPPILGSSRNATRIATLRRGIPDLDALGSALSSLYSTRASLNWRKIFSTLLPTAKLCEIPAYPFASTRFWTRYEERRDQPDSHSIPRFSLLGRLRNRSSPDAGRTATFETDMHCLSHLIAGHQVSGYALCPASVYLELALDSIHVLLERVGMMEAAVVVVISEAVYMSPLVYKLGIQRTVVTQVVLNDQGKDGDGTFTISSRISDSRGESQVHCQGSFSLRSSEDMKASLSRIKTTMEQRRQSICLSDKTSETFHTRTIYNIIFPRVVDYSKAYHTIQSVSVDATGVDAYAVVQLNSDAPSGCFVAHPIFVDTLIHIAGFVVNCNVGQNEVFICTQIDQVKILPETIDVSAVHGVYCNIGFLSETLVVADTYAIGLHDTEGVVVAHIKRMRFRKLKMDTFKDLLSTAARSPSDSHRSHARHYSEQSFDADSTAKPEWGSLLLNVIAETCGLDVNDVKMQSRLSDLGIDSLMSIELAGRLRDIVPTTRLNAHEILCAYTVENLLSHLQDDSTSQTISTSTTSGTLVNDRENSSERHVHTTPRQQLDLLTTIKEVISSVLDIPVEELEGQDLRLLGLDSLTSIEAHHALEAQLDVVLPNDILAKRGNIRDLHSALLRLSTDTVSHHQFRDIEETYIPSSHSIEINPVQYQYGNDPAALPLFLIHDGSGMAHSYSRLKSLCHSVWGIHNPRLLTGEPWAGGVVEMATHYVSMILAVSGGCRCIVGGWSFGGVVAFEIARQLIYAGVDVAGLLLIDSPPPLTHDPLPGDVIDTVIAGQDWLSQLVRTQMRHATKALTNYDPSLSPVRGIISLEAVMLRSQDPFPVRKTKCESVMFLTDRSDPAKSVLGWEKLLGRRVPILDIPGHHFAPFSPQNVRTRLVSACTVTDGASLD